MSSLEILGKYMKNNVYGKIIMMKAARKHLMLVVPGFSSFFLSMKEIPGGLLHPHPHSISFAMHAHISFDKGQNYTLVSQVIKQTD